MQAQLQYVTDLAGQKTSVIIPLKQWKKVEKQLEELEILKNTMAVFNSIKEGIAEVKQARKEGKKLQSATDYINEIRSQNR